MRANSSPGGARWRGPPQARRRTRRANDVTNSEPGEVAAFDVGFEGWIRVS